ncbi:MAG: GlsB/YeaQ/YmgE family stress response membrane protein [Gordonia sp. (in: high G+C Gram-positive bacteria)]|uniref:GlsB/YeaQ/YmgE family stress response membrane protein n=1 Tax=Gordonia sp. (in: high G+C Gram-positive bacteria) TaxID=84139 RepID=UPI0039E41287
MDAWIGSIVVTLVIGAIIGFVASKILKTHLSIVEMIVAGIIGSFVGSFILWISGLHPDNGFANWIWGWLTGIIGAIIVIFVYDRVKTKA